MSGTTTHLSYWAPPVSLTHWLVDYYGRCAGNPPGLAPRSTAMSPIATANLHRAGPLALVVHSVFLSPPQPAHLIDPSPPTILRLPLHD